jgi:peptidoglycan hydrolase FlgJ
MMPPVSNLLPPLTATGASPEAGATRLRTARGEGEIDRAAREFETMALSQMVALMMQDTDISDTPFGGGAGERAFKPFLVEEYAKAFAAQGGIGIASAVRAEMIRIQEAAQASPDLAQGAR